MLRIVSRHTRWIILCAVVTLSLLMIVNFASGLRAQTKTNSHELNIYLAPSVLNLDPHQMETAASMTIVVQLHRGLLRYDSNGDCVPDLAESWEASPDHTIYRFKLREAYFSNGERITSRHVVYSFARVFVVGAGIGADIDYIAGVRDFVASKKIEALGIRAMTADVVEFRLAKPSVIFLKHMAVADLAIMPYRSLDGIAQPPTAFSGPYKPAQEIPRGGFEEREFTITKWRKDHLDSVQPPGKIRFMNFAADPVELALSGENDTLDAIHVAKSSRVQLEARGWSAVPTELTKERFIVLNANHLSRELREFLYSRIDHEEVLKRIEEPGFEAAYGVIPNGFPGKLSREDLGLRSVAEYRGPKTKFVLDFNEDSELDRKIAQYAKEVWTTDRIDVALNPLPYKTRLERQLRRKSDAVIGIKAVDYPDGYSVLTYFKGKYEANFYFIDDARLDSQITATAFEFDSKKRIEAFKAIQRKILEFRTVIPLVFGSQASGLWSQKVRNVPSHPMGLHTMPLETVEMQNE